MRTPPIQAASAPLHQWAALQLREGPARCAPHLNAAVWRPWLETLPERLASQEFQELKTSGLVANGRKTFVIPGPDLGQVVVKHYPAVPPQADILLNSKDPLCHGTEAFQIHVDLWARNVPVPEPLACLNYEGADPAMPQYAITRLIDGCEPLLHAAFERLCRRLCPGSSLRRWGRRLVDAIIPLHQAGYAHGDLGHHNILVRLDSGQRDLEVFLTDFDACTRVAGTLPQAGQLMDLAMLGATLYQVVPDWALAGLLGYYLRRMILNRDQRRHSRDWVVEAHRRALDQYLACFEKLEERCLAQAQESLSATRTPS